MTDQEARNENERSAPATGTVLAISVGKVQCPRVENALPLGPPKILMPLDFAGWEG
jgi:hypothetical protein